MSKKNFLSVKCFLHFILFLCVFFKKFSFLSLRTTNDRNREEVDDIYNRAAVDLVGLQRERERRELLHPQWCCCHLLAVELK